MEYIKYKSLWPRLNVGRTEDCSGSSAVLGECLEAAIR